MSEKCVKIIYAFSHIFINGNSSYKWAEVLKADIFNGFKKNVNRNIGEEFSEKVMSKGGNDFLGRDHIEPWLLMSCSIDSIDVFILD